MARREHAEPKVPRYPVGATHIPALAAAAAATTGPMLEVGGGVWSTGLLSAVARATRRPLVTLEGLPFWAKVCRQFEHQYHQVIECGGHENVNPKMEELFEATRWGLAFVDHDTTPRVPAIRWLKDRADIIVAHDFGMAAYDYESVLPELTFYCGQFLDGEKCGTLVASQTIDVRKLF